MVIDWQLARLAAGTLNLGMPGCIEVELDSVSLPADALLKSYRDRLLGWAAIDNQIVPLVV